MESAGRPHVRELGPDELAAAAAVLGRSMRDNPLHFRVFGHDPDRRETDLTRLFRALLPSHHASHGVVLGAFDSDRLVGVCAMVQPGRCRPSVAEKLRLLPSFLLSRSGGLGLTLRVVKWTAQWSRRDLESGHWHLGPVGVERDLQRRGVGTALLAEVCARMDALPAVAYLETDKPENVTFYERFGFQVIDDAGVLGVRCWFMVRTP